MRMAYINKNRPLVAADDFWDLDIWSIIKVDMLKHVSSYAIP